MRFILGGLALAVGLAATIFAIADRVPSRRLADIGNVAPATPLTASASSPAHPVAKHSSGGTFNESPDDIGPSVPPAQSSPAALLRRPAERAQRVAQAAVEYPVTADRGATPPLSRNAVLHELQRQLKRVGCYKGRIGDDWATATRPSMIAFLERVNATLPTAGPDEVLLTLVRAAPGQVCGSPCPRGQSMADGRCQPDALLTRNPASEPASSGITSLPAAAMVSAPSVSGAESAMKPTGVPAPVELADAEAEAPGDTAVRRTRPRQRTPDVAESRPRNDNWVARAFGSGP
jgi:hypothetical protein